MATDLFRFNLNMRRLSCIPEALSLIPQRAELRRDMTFSETERRASQQEIDSAVHWLERRKSTDSNGAFGQLDESLYRKRNSIINVRGSKDSLCAGRVQIKLSYDFARSDFCVILMETTLDIKFEECQFVFKLGEDQVKQSRKILSGCAVNLQTFKFPIQFDELLHRTLTVELLSTKPSGYGTTRHGISVLPLSSLSPADELLVWLELETVNDRDCFGDLQLFLSFLPSAERLTLTVQEAVKLERLEPNQKDAAVYVKAALCLGDKVLKKRKSNVKKANSTNTFIFNESLTFCDVDSKTLARCRLEVVVMGCLSNGNQYPIGQVVFCQPDGPQCKENKIWKDMLLGRSNNLLHWLQLHECKT
ncbi:C2 domain-containing protein [Aphelenchoides bicaudatus]|nr:C2 domain-containing protein [Aphelenchoides bicaudatus]